MRGGADTPRQHPRRALCAVRIDDQTWTPGLAAAKRTARCRRKGPPRAPRPLTRTAAPTAARSRKKARRGPFKPLTRAAAPTAARPGGAVGRRGATQ
ncbi:hypothetical protein NDU88_005113 [Pleurodeles waltl]|uniref:Uncharacterized protein n=1 Tax=Pleurodeles waltl TaxID=8319 RepID=A0AAV7NUD8_PLEWA|nr:hypothetical protein NDU88_005113 [Pleurodeles waltl]